MQDVRAGAGDDVRASPGEASAGTPPCGVCPSVMSTRAFRQVAIGAAAFLLAVLVVAVMADRYVAMVTEGVASAVAAAGMRRRLRMQRRRVAERAASPLSGSCCPLSTALRDSLGPMTDGPATESALDRTRYGP